MELNEIIRWDKLLWHFGLHFSVRILLALTKTSAFLKKGMEWNGKLSREFFDLINYE
jgi:hypothetical protein